MTFPCAHIQRRSRNVHGPFFFTCWLLFLLLLLLRVSFLTQDRENSLHSSCVRILPLDANCFTGI
jgi:hypothetical protein